MLETQRKSKNVYLYVLNTLADWEIGFVTAELQSKRYLRKPFSLKLTIIGNTMDSVRSMGGLSIAPEIAVDAVDFEEGDLLILPGGNTWMENENQKILNRVPALLEKGVAVAAICGATVALAQLGLLNAKKHTSNDKGYLKRICPNYRGDSLYVEAPAVVDDNLITASGIAPLEFAYAIFQAIDCMKADTLEAWYQLYQTQEPKYFYKLMESLNE